MQQNGSLACILPGQLGRRLDQVRGEGHPRVGPWAAAVPAVPARQPAGGGRRRGPRVGQPAEDLRQVSRVCLGSVESTRTWARRS